MLITYSRKYSHSISTVWYFDSVVTTNVTNNTAAISSPQPCAGFNGITVGNGSSVHISNSGLVQSSPGTSTNTSISPVPAFTIPQVVPSTPSPSLSSFHSSLAPSSSNNVSPTPSSDLQLAANNTDIHVTAVNAFLSPCSVANIYNL
ncbi:hypothetical protein U1Q18_009337 [Sarracenia purpurea var. burkii]